MGRVRASHRRCVRVGRDTDVDYATRGIVVRVARRRRRRRSAWYVPVCCNAQLLASAQSASHHRSRPPARRRVKSVFIIHPRSVRKQAVCLLLLSFCSFFSSLLLLGSGIVNIYLIALPLFSSLLLPLPIITIKTDWGGVIAPCYWTPLMS